MIKLSIIVPIYGVEQYLRKCVDSLLNQDILSSEYEIILVDDGSPDACPQICDEYATAHKNIRVVHRKNGGLSAARNSGIKVAQGEYVMFVDSDDYIELNVLKGLIEQVERDNLDVLRFKYQNVRIVNSEYEVFQPYKRDQRLENDYSETVTEGVSFLNSRMNTQCYAVMFIVKRSLLYNDEMSRDNSLNEPLTLNDACLFTEGIYFEDTDWTPRMLMKAKRAASTEKVVYNYLVREGSITKAINRNKQKKVLDDKIRLVKTLKCQTMDLALEGKDNRWFNRMIADTVISIISILSTQFYKESKEYLTQLQELDIYPIQSKNAKARLINFSPYLAIMFLHMKNNK